MQTLKNIKNLYLYLLKKNAVTCSLTSSITAGVILKSASTLLNEPETWISSFIYGSFAIPYTVWFLKIQPKLLKLIYKMIPSLQKRVSTQMTSWITDTMLFRLIPFGYHGEIPSGLPIHDILSYFVYGISAYWRAIYWMPEYYQGRDNFMGFYIGVPLKKLSTFLKSMENKLNKRIYEKTFKFQNDINDYNGIVASLIK